MTEPDILIERLEKDFYGNLFNYHSREESIAKISREKDLVARLRRIVADEKAPLKARFLACEILSEKEKLFEGEVNRPQLAKIYTRALVQNIPGNANAWGLLYEEKDDGPVGIHFLMIGRDAIPFLSELLDNSDQTLRYEGSEEATVGNAYRYRIKDFAAYYIGRIRGKLVPYHAEHVDRDAEIERLKAALLEEQR